MTVQNITILLYKKTSLFYFLNVIPMHLYRIPITVGSRPRLISDFKIKAIRL